MQLRGGLRAAIKRGSDLYHLHGDHLSSTSLNTDGVGAVTASRTYYAYGAERAAMGDLQTDRTFTGQKSDATGLIYFNARYYDPALGAFISPDSVVPDPMRVADYNRFLYTRGNPLSYTDPSGQCPKPDGDYAKANIICVAGFIPTETSVAIPEILYFVSDNRGFSSNSAKASSRFWIWIDADTGQKIDAYVHPTQEATGQNGEPQNEPWATRLERIFWKDWLMGSSFLEPRKLPDGSILLDYKAVCSHPICNNMLAAEGFVVFKPNEHGPFDSYGVVDHFPSLEAYHWKGGQLQSDNLFQI